MSQANGNIVIEYGENTGLLGTKLGSFNFFYYSFWFLAGLLGAHPSSFYFLYYSFWFLAGSCTITILIDLKTGDFVP
nr:hypothetical protein CFP56_04907 [Quercus suber]